MFIKSAFLVLSFPSPPSSTIIFTIVFTSVIELGLVPKFHVEEYLLGCSNCFLARIKYPFKGSRTCCQGLLKFGLRITIVFFLIIDLMQSGIKRFSDQSPPPITLPALAVETAQNFLFFK